jgi:signal transduction histidine kinase
MNRFLLILAVLAFSVLWCNAQLPLNEKEYADSLEKVLISTKSDSLKARANYQLSHYWSIHHNTRKGNQYLQRGKAYSKKYPYLQAIYYFFESNLYLYEDPKKSTNAILEGERQLLKFETKESYTFRSKLWYNLAILAQEKDDQKATLDIILNKVIPFAKKSQDTLMLAKYYSQAGKIFMNNDQLEKAEEYYNRTIDLIKNKPTKSTILLNTYIIASSNYIFLKKYSKAKIMLDKAKNMLSKFPKSISQSDYYWAEGNYHEEIGQYSQALKSYNIGMSMATEQGQDYIVQALEMQKYSVLTKLKRYSEALPLITKVARDTAYMSTTNNRKSIFNELAKTYNHLGNDALAYTWLRRYSLLNDSINDSQLKNDINKLEIKFRNLENQKKIATLEAEKEKVILSSKNSRLMIWLLGTAVVLFLAVTIFTLNYYRGKSKLDNTTAMLEGEERERKRIARDLHDGLGGMLAGVKIKLSSWAANKHNLKTDVELDQIIYQLDDSLNELRYIAHNMMPENLVKFGLETALKDLCDSMSVNNNYVVFQSFLSDADIPTKIQPTIYRIVQELLYNAKRHANAQNIIVQCSQNEGSFFITVEDDGIGFAQNSLVAKNGMGLRNIQSRVNYLNGKMEIVSNKQEKGSAVNIELNVYKSEF